MPFSDPDPSQPRPQRSLFGDILDWLLVPLLLLWPLSVVLIWFAAQGIANRPFDRDLGETARTLARRVAVGPGPGAQRTRFELSDAAVAVLRGDQQDAFFFQVLGTRGEWIAGERNLPVPVPERGTAPVGDVQFRDEELGERAVRVAYVWVPAALSESSQPPLVQVAETLDKRSQLATEIARGVMLSQFAILPLAVLLVWFALMRGLRPLDVLQRRIRQRASGDLSPIDERVAPEEVSPLVAAINEVLRRLDASLATQKHFLADAAHQLKTPLAGLRTQAELAQREIDAGDAKAAKRSLQQIARSSLRAAHMVNQLLAMARAEDRGEARRTQTFNLAALATEAVHDFVPRALAKGIDLGYEGPGAKDASAPKLTGEPLLVREMIRNLVDNAVQYTPGGGTVTVRVLADPFGQVAVLQVEDNGPGIPEAERELVFQPFYRALGTEVDGSGLGLAIVREVVDRHGGDVAIEAVQPRAAAPGARITVRLPLTAATG
ncbi:MAG TPA: sensor histidine kinase N-terminal domain-containing protein [Burkholderiaceae bacterium]|nr:sensor histidine kinase N-terminal domain-containing protein [Burkholderiaceae bacterium]